MQNHFKNHRTTFRLCILPIILVTDGKIKIFCYSCCLKFEMWRNEKNYFSVFCTSTVCILTIGIFSLLLKKCYRGRYYLLDVFFSLRRKANPSAGRVSGCNGYQWIGGFHFKCNWQLQPVQLLLLESSLTVVSRVLYLGYSFDVFVFFFFSIPN